MIEKYISCSCGSSEHTLRFILNKEDGEIYTEVYLNQHRSFFKRAIIGIKYILGYKSRYGHWDCFSADREKILELKNFINDAIKLIEAEHEQ